MDNSLLIMILLGVVVIVLLALWFIRARRVSLPEHTPESLQQVADARIEEGERAAAIISEQIEQMVRLKLASDPDLAKVSIDFATSQDGSLEVWVNGIRYTEIEQIPDARIRQSVQEAVETFNK